MIPSDVPLGSPIPRSIPSVIGDSVLDVTELTRLANQFFSALPGSSVAGPEPSLSPQAPALHLPDTDPAGVSTQTDRLSNPVPASLQGFTPSPSSFYFLQELRNAEPQSGVTGLNSDPLHLTPPASPLTPPPVTARSVFPTPSAAPFYFLPEVRSPEPRTGVPGLPSDSIHLASKPSPASQSFDVNLIRRDFSILQERVNGRQLIWFDNAATTQKPQSVINCLSYFYEHENSNIHRAAHELAARATDAYEAARQKVHHFLGASSPNEIVFVRGSTEAINLVAQSWGRQEIQKDDEIVISWLEHHANIVPWQMLCAEKDAKLKVIPVDDDGQILLDEYRKLLGDRTKLVSFSQVSNALGTITPAEIMTQMAHACGAKVLVDGAQAVSHMPVNVQLLDADFYVFSGHKLFAPTGIGVLYGKEALLNSMPPWQGGGNMIQDVTFERTRYHAAPLRFEAGTGNIADAVGLGEAIDYITRIGMENIGAYEHQLVDYATRKMTEIPGLRIIGTAANKASVLSFVLEGYKTEEIGAALNRDGIAVRSGHHCAQPILRRFGLESTVRPSLAFYNTHSEIDAMLASIRKLQSAKGHSQNLSQI